MSARLVSQELSQSPRVLIYPSTSRLAQEVVRQLRLYSPFSVITLPDDKPVEVYLDFYSVKNKPLVIRYAKKIVVDPASVFPSLSQSAAEIISRFIYHYHLVEETSPPVHMPLVLPSPSSSPRPHKTFSLLILVIFLPIIPWLLLVIQLIILSGLSYCSLKISSLSCIQTAARLSEFMEYQLPAAIGSRSLLIRLGYPPDLIVAVFHDYSAGVESLNRLQKVTDNLYSSFQNSGIDQSSLESLPYLITSASDSLAYFQSSLKDLYLSTPHPPSFILPLADKISQQRSFLSHLQHLLPDLPNLLGYNRKLTYLVLLQDHTEIRPTGGFLDSFILATVENGRLLDSQDYTSYQADAQLHGLVEPPALYKQITGLSQWFLRDSNWDPDFPTTAQRAAWFISKEYSRTVDVVLGMNTTYINQPEFLPRYLSTVKPLDQDPGTSLTKYFHDSPGNFQHFIDQLESHQIIIAPQTISSPAVIFLGWDGGVVLPSCSISVCQNDYFFAVDTNLSGNKSDAYLTRSQSLSVNFSDSQVNYSYRLTYRNHPPNSAWPAGNHQNFLRIYLPPGLAIDQLQVNNQPVLSSRMYFYSEHGLQVVGVSVDTAPQKITSVELTAHQRLPVESFHYQLQLLHQPGIQSYPMELSFSYPASWQVLAFQTPDVASVGRLKYNMTLSRPISINLDFKIP